MKAKKYVTVTGIRGVRARGPNWVDVIGATCKENARKKAIRLHRGYRGRNEADIVVRSCRLERPGEGSVK